MKPAFILLGAITAACLAQEPGEAPDPTLASPRMKAALMAGGTAIPELTVRGIVLSAERNGGAVMLEVAGGARVLARPNVPFTVVADAEARKLVIKRISSEGIEIEAVAQKETVTLPSFGPIGDQRGGNPGEVDYVEFRDIPLIDALRMLSDQTGLNFSASSESNKIPVNAMLRDVSASAVVEELCKGHGLWFKRDEKSGITRIMTVTEFEKDLVGYREEQTEVFTLKYPNVTEVAYAIADLYGDRVEFSLGAEDSDEDMRNDLESRFERFQMMTQQAQQAGSQNGTTILGNNVNGFYGNNAGGFQSFGSESSRNRFGSDSSSRDRYNRRNESQRSQSVDEDLFRNLTPDQAQRVETALRRGGDAANVEALRKKPATIYVTGSRRNNMVVVRTADSRAMDEIRKLVTRMDVQTPLVLLEVKVVSIELGDEFRSAFDYQFGDGTIGASFARGAITRPLGAGGLTAGVAGAGFNSTDMTFVVVSDNFRARMQLFEQQNRVKTVASPTLLTANNEVSRLFLGEERPLVRSINSQTIITDNNVATTPSTTTEFRNVGNTLMITPNINSDRTVTLRLVQENSFINPDAASIPVVTSGNSFQNGTVQKVSVDTVSTRTVSGTFVAKDAMMVAAGGLIEDVESKKIGQVPVLGRIPGLGVLFQRREKVKTRRELVVIIRPYVLTTPADGERITRDMLDRMAPDSVEKLVDEGFLPSLPPAAVPKVISRPPPSAAASKKQPAPVEPSPARKKSSPAYKSSTGR